MISPGWGGRWFCGVSLRIVEGRVHGGYTDAWELVCCDCGDHPELDCRDVSPELQRIRGPYSFAAGITAYGKHVNLYHRQTPTFQPGPAGAPRRRPVS